MKQVPVEIAADLATAFTAEREARAAVRTAVRRQVALLRCLRDGGVPLTAVALARLLGEAASPEVRHRLAARLRQRIRRVTERHADQREASPHAGPATLRSVEEATTKENAAMPTKSTLVRRTITTEVYASPDVDPEIESDEEIEDEEPEDDDEDEPSRKKRR